jgi:cytoskeletal protein CcmA (bactofilin family)
MPALITEIPVPTLITEGSRVQGNLTFLGTTQIHGMVEGDVQQQSLDPLCIGRTGWVKGSIQSVGNVLVEGRVDGDITSTTKIKLATTATVHGTLNAPSIEVRPGALFEGEFHMKSSAARAKGPTSAKRAA